MRKALLASLLFIAGCSTRDALVAPPLMLSHSWIVVTTGAREREALEKAGFRIAPTVNRHEGQGTASVTVEFLNGFLELIYPDPSVPVSPALQAGAEKFRLKSAWRETGYSPIGIVFDRTPATPAELPFATWKISADWMEKGTFIEKMTPKEMTKAVSLSISSHAARTRESENEALARDPVKGAMFLHPNGARRLTGLRVVAPDTDSFPPAASYIAGHGLMKFDIGNHWLLDVTLDNGKQVSPKTSSPIFRWSFTIESDLGAQGVPPGTSHPTPRAAPDANRAAIFARAMLQRVRLVPVGAEPLARPNRSTQIPRHLQNT